MMTKKEQKGEKKGICKTIIFLLLYISEKLLYNNIYLQHKKNDDKMMTKKGKTGITIYGVI